MQKNLKMIETQAHGYSSESTQRELSDTSNMTGLAGFQKSLCSCALDESSLRIGRVKKNTE